MFDIKLEIPNQKIHSNKTLAENELKKLQAFDSIYFRGKSCFEEDCGQNLLFQPMYRYFKKINGVSSGEYIYFWKSKELSDQKISSITASSYRIKLLWQ